MRRKVRAAAKRVKAAVARFFVWRKTGPRNHRVVEIVRGQKALDKS